MQRRDVLRLLATGAALQLAPHKLIAFAREARSLIQAQARPRALNAHQYATVKTMAEMIIPRTDTPGATDVGTAEFVDLILTDWYEDAERTRFLAGLADVDSRARNLFARDFVDCSFVQQSDILIALGEKMVADKSALRNQPSTDSAPPPDKNFYEMLRQLTLTAYYTSEAGATGELHYEIVPGLYQGCSAVPSVQEAPKKQ